VEGVAVNDEVKKKLELAAAAFAVALLSSLGTMLTTCSAGIATKGDVAQSTAEIKQELAKCAQRSELGPIPDPDRKLPPVYRRLEALEIDHAAMASQHALNEREHVAYTIAFWRLVQSGKQRETWIAARDAAFVKWEEYALGRPPDKTADMVLRAGGVPR
jgi:hypothetical protein